MLGTRAAEPTRACRATLGGAMNRRLVVAGLAVVSSLAVAPPLHVPLFVHQLSFDGLNGELGGQSRVAEIGAIAVYFDPLYVTAAPLA